jgi:hypothetical protein
MTLYQPATPHSDAIIRPHCIQCGGKMMLARIEAAKPGHETHTFECGKCERSITHVAKIK